MWSGLSPSVAELVSLLLLLRVMVKLGPRYDMGKFLPSPDQWDKVAKGKDFCVWEKKK